MSLLRLFYLYCLLSTWEVAGNPIVSTKYGDVEGLSIPIHTGQVIDTFMAVPFAKPPVNERRFKVGGIYQDVYNILDKI